MNEMQIGHVQFNRHFTAEMLFLNNTLAGFEKSDKAVV